MLLHMVCNAWIPCAPRGDQIAPKRMCPAQRSSDVAVGVDVDVGLDVDVGVDVDVAFLGAPPIRAVILGMSAILGLIFISLQIFHLPVRLFSLSVRPFHLSVRPFEICQLGTIPPMRR